METLLVTLIGLLFTSIFGYLTYLAKTKIANEDLEKLIVNAISYAEEISDAFAKNKIKESISEIEPTSKMALAKDYIDKIDPKIITKYGDNIEALIESKLAQLEGVGATQDKAISSK